MKRILKIVFVLVLMASVIVLPAMVVAFSKNDKCKSVPYAANLDQVANIKAGPTSGIRYLADGEKYVIYT